jgi:hypothetical protein
MPGGDASAPGEDPIALLAIVPFSSMLDATPEARQLSHLIRQRTGKTTPIAVAGTHLSHRDGREARPPKTAADSKRRPWRVDQHSGCSLGCVTTFAEGTSHICIGPRNRPPSLEPPNLKSRICYSIAARLRVAEHCAATCAATFPARIATKNLASEREARMTICTATRGTHRVGGCRRSVGCHKHCGACPGEGNPRPCQCRPRGPS